MLDTNVLLRMSTSEDPLHPTISSALQALVSHGARLCFTSQVLGEFWNASTRPFERNGFGLSINEADRLTRVIERDFEYLPDSRDVHYYWRQLLLDREIRGVQVHDARIAASMYVHGVSQLLTINVRDFQRFPLLSAVHPSEIVHSTL